MDDLKLYGKSTAEVESLLNTVGIFSDDVSMEFGLDKCATLTITKGKVTETEGMNLPNNNINGLNLNETYKYLQSFKQNLNETYKYLKYFKQMISNIHKSKRRH